MEVALVFAIIAAYRLEKVDLVGANPAPPGEPVSRHPIYRFTKRTKEEQGTRDKEEVGVRK